MTYELIILQKVLSLQRGRKVKEAAGGYLFIITHQDIELSI